MLKKMRRKIGIKLKSSDSKIIAAFYQIYVKIYNVIFKKPMRKKCFGEKNKDKTFYVICFENEDLGFMSLFLTVCACICYALEQGWIPIVDWKNYKCQYWIEGKNAWDLFFSQPSQYSLEEVYQSKNVVILGNSRGGHRAFEKYSFWSSLHDADVNRKKRNFILKYVDVKSQIKQEVDEYVKKLPMARVLGVFVRGTDMTALKLKNHPVQPSTEQLKNKIQEFLNKHTDIQKIFLVTEDETIRMEIEKEYGDLLLPNMGMTFKNYDNKDFLYKYVDEENRLQNTKTYLEKLMILGECGYFITSIASGSVFSLAYKDEHKERYIFNLGSYK